MLGTARAGRSGCGSKPMDHSQFTIGMEFWSGEHQWRCTDVGTRVIVAIRIDPVEIAGFDDQGGTTRQRLTRAEAEQGRWFAGPPYAVQECVFDEDALEGCSLTREDVG